MREWEEVATILYRDGATIKSELDRENGDVCLTLARKHETPDDQFVITMQQANEIIYVLSKAIVQYTEDEVHDER